MQWRIILLFVAMVTLFFFSSQRLDGGVVVAPVQSAQATTTHATSTANTVSEVKREYHSTTSVALREELVPVCACESTGSKYGTPTHYAKDGTVIRGKINPHDIGICQVNADYHEVSAKEMGLDIYTEEGNIRYANHLFETQGLQPWSWSRSCWQ